MESNEWELAIERWTALERKLGKRAPKRALDAVQAIAALRKWPEPRQCNICGCPLFIDQKRRRNARCMNCGSLERTRMLFLFLRELDMPKPDSRVFHLAPERGLYRYISSIVPQHLYTIADIQPEKYMFAHHVVQFDLCKDVASLPDNHFDLILHSHVMEHVPCNYAYVLKNLHRALKPNGWHVCIIPYADGYYDECFAPLSAEEATRRFGQYDHVRRFGKNDLDRSLGRVIKLEPEYDVTLHFPPETLVASNIPKVYWSGFANSTVLRLRKQDYLL